jgi:hypothetical protein
MMKDYTLPLSKQEKQPQLKIYESGKEPVIYTLKANYATMTFDSFQEVLTYIAKEKIVVFEVIDSTGTDLTSLTYKLIERIGADLREYRDL